MKRMLFAFITLLICTSMLISCEEVEIIQYNDDFIGLHYELPEELEYYKYADRGTYKNYRNSEGSVAVVISYYTNEEILASDAFNKLPTLKEYINHTIQGQQLGDIEVYYSDEENRATFDFTVRESADAIGQYIYHTLIKTEDAIYIIQMICHDAEYEYYVTRFINWSNRIYTY